MGEYIDIFTYKIKLDNYESSFTKEEIEEIKEIFIGVDTLLNNEYFFKYVSNNKDKNLNEKDSLSSNPSNDESSDVEFDIKYYSMFVIHLFNFSYYFETMKKHREHKNIKKI